MFTNKIANLVAEANTLDQINAVSSTVWKSYAAALISDGSAQGFSEVLEAKKKAIATSVANKCVRRSSGALNRPVTHERLRRRRMWSASSQIPASIAAHYTPGQAAALSVVVSLLRSNPTVTKTLQEIGDMAGVCRKTVQRMLLVAKTLGHLKVIERRASVTRNLPHRISALDPALRQWIDRKPRVTRTLESSLKKQIFTKDPTTHPNSLDRKPLLNCCMYTTPQKNISNIIRKRSALV